MADAADSKSAHGDMVGVRVPSRAKYRIKKPWKINISKVFSLPKAMFFISQGKIRGKSLQIKTRKYIDLRVINNRIIEAIHLICSQFFTRFYHVRIDI